MIRAVLFDAAGTLIRLRVPVGVAYATVAAEHGAKVHAAAIEARFRHAFGRMPPLCFPGAPPAALPALERAWWKQLVRVVLDGVHFADFDAYFDHLFDHFAAGRAWELYPDVVPALEGLRARGVRMVVVSNFDARLVGICEDLGIASFFDAIVVSARAGFAKPDPDIFHITARRAGVRAEEALHVGDSEEEDLRGARAAGMRAVRIARNRGAVSPGEIDDLRQLLGLTR